MASCASSEAPQTCSACGGPSESSTSSGSKFGGGGIPDGGCRLPLPGLKGASLPTTKGGPGIVRIPYSSHPKPGSRLISNSCRHHHVGGRRLKGAGGHRVGEQAERMTWRDWIRRHGVAQYKTSAQWQRIVSRWRVVPLIAGIIIHDDVLLSSPPAKSKVINPVGKIIPMRQQFDNIAWTWLMAAHRWLEDSAACSRRLKAMPLPQRNSETATTGFTAVGVRVQVERHHRCGRSMLSPFSFH